ncbi:MAG: hypothetical protein ACI9BD_000330 [Candidatus Marinamargulisbacteria bacterium]|jgi:hypothetical protein
MTNPKKCRFEEILIRRLITTKYRAKARTPQRHRYRVITEAGIGINLLNNPEKLSKKIESQSVKNPCLTDISSELINLYPLL